DYERNAAAIPQNSSKRHQQNAANTIYDFQIQPNPSNGLFNLHWKTTAAEAITQLYIYDLQGQQKVVIPLNAPNQQQSIDVSHLPVGVYYCKLEENDHINLVKKLVITK
ncbi:MAG: T9SS type A sorting domain-containing protein, partial [Chitinophagales bacterium]